MSLTSPAERIGTVLVVSLLASGLFATVALGVAGVTGTVGTLDSSGALAGDGSDAGSVADGPAVGLDDAATGPAAIGHAPAQADDRNRITFDHAEGERAFYEVTVSGSIEAGPEADLTDAESVDRISGNRATGSVAEGGDDDYFFTGEITSLEVDGPVTVYVNGERVDPDEIDEATTTEPPTTTTTSTTTTTETETDTPTSTDTETETGTATPPTTTETETPSDTATSTATATGTGTPSPTATPNASVTTGAAGGESQGFTEQERGLFLTLGGVLLLGVLAIAGFVWFARQE